jgi:penicillin-binding protein 1B
MLRALITNLREGAIRQGGSTLTQQLAKNYFLTPERTLKRKLNELLIALILEVRYEKDEILEIYLNEIYWGQKGSVSINGVGAAARFYFDKPADALSLDESAVLAGLIKAPNRYSPYIDRSLCQKRRNAVLQLMHANGWLDEATLQASLPRPVISASYTAYSRQAPYFIDYLTHQLATLYSPEVLSNQ